ncbi:MAG: flippase-like domain-containing protein [Anaerolineae bacterium]|nr:flippase-like domain-containing protein [Anaerolineae bacterium]
MTKRLSPALLNIIKIVIAIGLLLYLAIGGAIDWSSLARLGSRWDLAFAALLALMAAVTANAIRLCILFRPPALFLTFWSSLRLTMVGTFFNACLPGSTGGDLVRMYYASEGNNGRRAETVTVILLDRVVGLLALLLVPLIVLLLLPGLAGSFQFVQEIALGAAGISVLVITGLVLGAKLFPRIDRISFPAFERLRLKELLSRFDALFRTYGDRPGMFLTAIAVALVSHGFTIFAMLMITLTIVPEPLNPSIFVLMPVGFLANAVPITPGGLGVGEVAFTNLFALAGARGGAETLLSWRVLTIVVGLFGLVFYLNGRKQFKMQLTPPASTQQAEVL